MKKCQNSYFSNTRVYFFLNMRFLNRENYYLCYSSISDKIGSFHTISTLRRMGPYILINGQRCGPALTAEAKKFSEQSPIDRHRTEQWQFANR